jgi:hypothetical protein
VTKLVHIPFGKGQNETADPKLLPAGLLREAVNVRLRADGRLGCRYGYADLGVDVLSDSAVSPHDLASFNDQRLLLANGDRMLVSIEQGSSWKALDDANAAARSLRILSDVEAVARPPLQNQSTAADCALNTSGWACVVWVVPVGAVKYVCAMVVRVSDGTVLCQQRLDATEDTEAVRVLALGTKFYVLHVDDTTTDLEVWTLDTATEGSFTVASAQLIDTLDIHNSFEFDARANGSSEFIVAWRKSATEISWECFNGSTFATVGSRQTVTANGKLALSVVENGHVAIANITSAGAVEVRTWNESAQTLVNTTTVGSGTTAVGQPWVELNAASTSAMVSWGATVTGVNATHPEWRYRTINPTSHALGTQVNTLGARPASGSFYMPSGETGLWLVDTDSVERGYTLARFGASRTPEPEGMIEKPYAATAALVNERRGKVVSVGSGEFIWAALALPANADPTAAALDTLPVLYKFKVEQQKRVQSARLGGDLYFAGGIVSVFDGCRYYEQDWCTTPTFDEVTVQTGAGDLISESIYTYARVLEWTDAQGQRLFSAPSTPVQATLAAGNNTVRLEVSPPFTRKLDAAMAGASVNDIIYRSKSDGITLRELTRLKWSVGQVTPQSVTDATDDCGCDGKPLIYTQGSRGAVSGPLQNDAVNACDYIWAGRDRIIVGRRDGVQWSLRKSDSEAVGFSNSDSFKRRLPGVTGVASLDERWIVFTKDAIWEITGDGPDDDGIQGEFSAPRRLPAEGGCVDSRSLVEVSSGLIYQQSADRLYLLPRGGGAPVWFSQPVRATLAAYPVITSAVYVRQDNAVVFTCNNSGGTAGVFVVHDMRTGDWYVDELGGAPVVLGAAAWSGSHAICSSSFVRLQTTAFADVSAAIAMRIRTGAIRPFGVNAWGMVHTVTLLGEYRGDCTVALRFSFDDGRSFTSLTSHALSGLTAGTAKRLQWSLPRTRTDHVVLEWTCSNATPSEGLAFNAFTLEVEAADGPPRLAAGDRK